MTTIAYKDGIMAADTMTMWGDEAVYGECKLATYRHFLIGFSGSVSPHYDIYLWICNAIDSHGELKGLLKERKKLCDVAGEGAGCMIVDTEKNEIWSVHLPGSVGKVSRKYDVLGSGGDIALGAMHVGATAVDAVQAAIDLNTYTGGSVHTITKDTPNGFKLDISGAFI